MTVESDFGLSLCLFLVVALVIIVHIYVFTLFGFLNAQLKELFGIFIFFVQGCEAAQIMPRRLANMESIVYFSPHKKHAIIVNKETEIKRLGKKKYTKNPRFLSIFPDIPNKNTFKYS